MLQQRERPGKAPSCSSHSRLLRQARSFQWEERARDTMGARLSAANSFRRCSERGPGEQWRRVPSAALITRTPPSTAGPLARACEAPSGQPNTWRLQRSRIYKRD
ncbi:hypothetical protein AAFF_G00069110 [Aldrovandia affinis]|uniref:Uncharacterized protein n=1 Tax=Aldrovandia affinis TaxID=143900 RepID=A0AAD7RZD3_9TELE|nr:hypothetical protein AAFF_G00069110 [Aldrovandia affinis]